MAKIKIELKRKGANYSATAIYDTKSNIVKIEKESKMPPTITGGSQIAKDERTKIRGGKIVDAEGVFQEDYDINPVQQGDANTPLARASDIIAGFNNGLKDWKIIGGDYPEYIGKTMQEWTIDYKRKKCSSGETDDLVHTDNDMYLGQNVIFYGVPGCGKSHEIKKILEGVDTKYYKRILFHPEYSYSDFVGQLKPVVKKSGHITYDFVPGPFTEILQDAYSNAENNYFLIIEEINRGNAPAIFGDLFQLLDRDDNGESEYSIYNKDMLGYFEDVAVQSKNENTELLQKTRDDGIKIPKNLTIFATMNTCDQNVFTLDTAFKRRWRMSRIVNNFDKDSSISAWEISFKQKSDGFLWKDFAKAVNDAILSNCNDGTAAEDKQLGTHFIKESDLTPARRFAEKVLMYLWDDVAKYDKSQLFDTKNYKTLDMVIDGFVDGNNVFSPNCAELQELYKKMNQPEQTNDNGTEVSLEAEAGTDRPAEGAPEAADEEQGRE